jgi:hypothetical protein
VLLVKVYDPIERDLPDVNMIVGDGEKQLSVTGNDKKIKRKFEEGFDMDLSTFETEMKRHRIPLIKLNTVDDVDAQLKNIFQ